MLCPSCYQKVDDYGIAGEVFKMICEYYFSHEDSIAFYEPYFAEMLKFLEMNGYIITHEAEPEIIFAKPKIIALDDGITEICCSGNCQRTLIEFKPDEA